MDHATLYRSIGKEHLSGSEFLMLLSLGISSWIYALGIWHHECSFCQAREKFSWSFRLEVNNYWLANFLSPTFPPGSNSRWVIVKSGRFLAYSYLSLPLPLLRLALKIQKWYLRALGLKIRTTGSHTNILMAFWVGVTITSTLAFYPITLFFFAFQIWIYG